MNHKGLFLTFALAIALAPLTTPVRAQSAYRRANFINATDPREGRCTISVIVDGASDVEIRGDHATLRDISGEPARWQRFECTEPLPYNPVGMRIRAVEGNGRMTLTHDTSNGGVAVVRVNNFGRGDEMYTFDVFWDNGGRSSNYYSGTADREVTDNDSMQSCRSAVESRIRNDGFRNVRFGSMSTDDRGATEFVSGTATGDRPYRSEVFGFSCRVNPYDGQVRRVDITRR